MLYWPIAGGHVATSFNEQLDQHGIWRREVALRLKLLGEWMNDHELLDSAVQERIKQHGPGPAD